MFNTPNSRPSRRRAVRGGALGSAVDLSLTGGQVQSEVASSTTAFTVSTKNNLGAQTTRLRIQSGQAIADTTLQFQNCGSANFNDADCQNLHIVTPSTTAGSALGGDASGVTAYLPWPSVYAKTLFGGDTDNNISFITKVGDGGGGQATVLTVTTANPNVATWASDMKFTRKLTNYNNVATAGWGVPAIYAAGRVTAQTAANASISTYTVGAADGSFRVSANMRVSASTTLVTTLTCTYTDEGSTARSMIFPITQLSGSFIALGAITGTGVWETPVMHIRCKAATAITILTSTGTFTGVTYTAEGIIDQVA